MEEKEKLVNEEDFVSGEGFANEENIRAEKLDQEIEDESDQETVPQAEDELASKQKEIDDLTDSLLRLRADFANYKNRVEKEKKSTIAYALEGLIGDLLPVLDNFERAMDSAEVKDGFYEGVNMIYEQLIKVLNDNGLQEIECVGESFDPNLHHAVFTEEVDDVKEGTVLEAFQKGYLLKDKVIRPSMVKVAK